MSDIDTGVVVSLKVLVPDGRLEKRTNSRHLAMSALVPKPDSCTTANTSLFDHLVGDVSKVNEIVRPSARAVFRIRPLIARCAVLFVELVRI